jgi:hypothetical protein
LSENNYLNLSREFNTESPLIVARYTDAIGKMRGTKTCEMPWTAAIYMEIAIPVEQVQPANEVVRPLLTTTEIVRNP